MAESKSKFHQFGRLLLSLITISSLLLAAYTAFFQTKSAQLQWRILDRTALIDIRDDVDEIKVFFKEKDLSKGKEKITLGLVELRNIGSKPVLLSEYDSRALVGLQVMPGEVIKADVYSSSNDYLGSYASVRIPDDRRAIVLEPVIIEPDQFVRVKVFVLHEEHSMVSFSALGKVAGSNAIDVVPIESVESEKGVLEEALTGSVLVQFIRSWIYFFIMVFGFFVVAAVFAAVKAITGKIQRSRRVDIYTDIYQNRLTKYSEYLLNQYRRHGSDEIRRLIDVSYQISGFYPSNDIPFVFHSSHRAMRLIDIYKADLMELGAFSDSHNKLDDDFVFELKRLGSFLGIESGKGENTMKIVIRDLKDGAIVHSQDVVVGGLNYEIKPKEYFDVAWKAAVEDGAVKESDREAYFFEIER